MQGVMISGPYSQHGVPPGVAVAIDRLVERVGGFGFGGFGELGGLGE